jgi:MazG family protein
VANGAKNGSVEGRAQNGGRRFFDEAVALLERLRGPGGCPWDREQKMTDLRAYITEEAYELADAISRGDMNEIREEAGDLLLQILFVSSLAKEENAFGIEEVAQTLCEKLIRRHPHVFASAEAKDSEQALRGWERVKREEREDKKEDVSVLAGIPKGLPPLLKAHRIQGKAAHVGFDWPKGDTERLFGKLDEEMAELREAAAGGNPSDVEDELGDLLFMAVNVSRHLNIDPDAALSGACGKFSARFRKVERDAAARGLRLNDCSPAELDALWNQAKRDENE